MIYAHWLCYIFPKFILKEWGDECLSNVNILLDSLIICKINITIYNSNSLKAVEIMTFRDKLPDNGSFRKLSIHVHYLHVYWLLLQQSTTIKSCCHPYETNGHYSAIRSIRSVSARRCRDTFTDIRGYISNKWCMVFQPQASSILIHSFICRYAIKIAIT